MSCRECVSNIQQVVNNTNGIEFQCNYGNLYQPGITSCLIYTPPCPQSTVCNYASGCIPQPIPTIEYRIIQPCSFR